MSPLKCIAKLASACFEPTCDHVKNHPPYLRRVLSDSDAGNCKKIL